MLFNITMGALISSMILTIIATFYASIKSAQKDEDRKVGATYILGVTAGALTKLTLLFGPGIIIAGALTLTGVI